MKKDHYKIETMQDIIDCTNEDNIDNFIKDFKSMLLMAHLQRDLHEGAGLSGKAKCNFKWIDDNKHNATIKFSDKSK